MLYADTLLEEFKAYLNLGVGLSLDESLEVSEPSFCIFCIGLDGNMNIH